MPGIRAFGYSDVEQVSALYETTLRSGVLPPPPGLAGYFERTFLEQPCFDPEIPSLVYEDARAGVIGFLGSNVRRFRFGGETVRLACSGPLVVAPAGRARAVGALLLARYLAGPQALTITDGATEEIRRMWERLGGHTRHLGCLRWTQVFEPAHNNGGPPPHRGTLDPPPGPSFSDVLRTSSRFSAELGSETVAEELTPASMLDHYGELTRSLRLYPDHDSAYLEWLFHELRQVKSKGAPIARLVRSADQQFAGWYFYFLRQGGHSQVFQVVAGEGQVGAVLDNLFAHARAAGAAVLEGRLEPELLRQVAARGCLLEYRGALPLIHSRYPDVLSAVASGQALLSRLEGEAWMGHRSEAFTG